MKVEIDRNYPLPLYYQIEKIIKEEIKDGNLKPGDMIPTEMDLMEMFSVSRATIRNAIKNLENDGYLKRERAKGTFVNFPPIERNFLGNLKCFSEEMKNKSIPHKTVVLKHEIIKADAEISEKLRIELKEPVFSLKRLRSVLDKPVLIVQSYIPYSICKGIENIDFQENSLYDTLEKKYGISLNCGKRIIEPKIVDSKETMDLLNLKENTCISKIESVIYSKNNQAVEYLVAEMVGKITIDLG